MYTNPDSSSWYCPVYPNEGSTSIWDYAWRPLAFQMEMDLGNRYGKRGLRITGCGLTEAMLKSSIETKAFSILLGIRDYQPVIWVLWIGNKQAIV